MKSLAAQLSFVLTTSAKASSDILFRKWQVEALLSQAADLLDRCLRDRGEYDELLARKALMEVQRVQDKARIDVAQERLDAGGLEQEAKTLELQMEGEGTSTILADYQSAEEYLQKINAGGGNEGDSAAARVHEIRVALSRTKASRSALQWQRDWANADRDRRGREQLKIPLDVYSHTGALMDSDGPLNYDRRLSAILARATRDFADAAMRISVAYEGLNEFYAFVRNGGAEPPIASDQVKALDIYQLDALVNWIRNAQMYLIGFCQLDQGWSLTVSLRKCVGDDAWKKALAAAKGSAGEIALTFTVDEQAFADHRFVRTRGVSCFLILDDKGVLPQFRNRISPWRATLAAPRMAKVIQEVFSTGDVHAIEVNQSAAPTCVLNRVESRAAPRGPEVAGQVSWMNISPIAAEAEVWKLLLQPVSQGSPAAKDLEDCEIELVLLGRPIGGD